MPRNAEDVRQRICEIAMVEFAEKGFQGASIQSIADSVGVAQTTVLFHFKTKKILFLNALNRMIDTPMPEFRQKYKFTKGRYIAREHLDYYFLENHAWIIEVPHTAQMMSMLNNFATFDPEFSGFYKKLAKNARAKIQFILEQGQKTKEFSFKGPAAEQALTLHDFVAGSILNIVTSGGKKGDVKKAYLRWRELTQRLLKLH